MTQVAIVLQARLGSTRLPGKVLAAIGGRSLLEHCIRRLATTGIPVIVATTTLGEDDAIERVATRLGSEVVRGSKDDVLGRYLETAATFGLTEIVRATADNPFVDFDAVNRTLAIRRQLEADHVVEGSLPIGAAVEALTTDALMRAGQLATDAYDREHVTSFLRRDGRFRAIRAVAPAPLRRSRLRLTVDTVDDLRFARDLHTALNNDVTASLATIIPTADDLLNREMLMRQKRGA